MRSQGCVLLAALLLLPLGAPAAQARYGGSLLGPGSHSGGGGAHTPPPGSRERAAIMDALRRKVGRVSGRYVVFNVRHLSVHGNWAWAVVGPQSPGGGTTYEPLAALLHKRGGQWTVSHILDGDLLTTDPFILGQKYPYAPADIF